MKNWLIDYVLRKSDVLRQLNQIRHEAEQIRNLATELVKAESTAEMREVIVAQCKVALGADAICLYLMQPRGYYEIIAQRSCTPSFLEQWHRIYPDKIPQVHQPDFREPLFFGSAKEFVKDFPAIDKVLAESHKKTVAYAPLVVHQKTIGIIGFSYCDAKRNPDKAYIMTLVNLCAQALERARLFELEQVWRREAEAANRAKSDFLRSMSHEIRTPIGAIKGFADLIHKSDDLLPKYRQWTARILQNAQHLNGLIGEVLDISKIEAEKIEVHRHYFSLHNFVEDVKAVTAFKADEKGIRLNFTSQVEEDLNVYSDPTQLRQILINLIGNAVKFTSDHGRVDVFLEHKGSNLHIEVRDTGIGIARADRERIFDPFVQVGNADAKIAGTGLGLAISKRLAVALGGDVKLVATVPGKGSTFGIDVPCDAQAARDANALSKAEEESLKGVNILLVDDSLDNLDLVKYLLLQKGAKVDTADNGAVGVEKALNSDYQIVIMDIQMPNMDGNQAISRLRSQGYRKPVVALTAEVLTSQREESLQRGFDDYLTKPFDSDLLIKTLGRLAKQG